MSLYFSTAKIDALQAFNTQQRQQILAIASTKLSVPEKLILNLIKLALLIPPFLLLAQMQGLSLVIAIFTSLLLYFILLRPIMLNFQLKHIDKAIKTYQSEQ